ncbi:MAG: DUF4254 domain-containing protein [Muribaculaceae bacterium]|nr:DUF4254 domain-containing protein [Muribaculaceae bacterium]
MAQTAAGPGLAGRCNVVFDRATADYHVTDSIDAEVPAPFPAGSIEALLYAKNWIDVAQWHMEDLIRDPQIDPAEGMKLKRRIDASNQDRTDRVEDLDTYFRELYKEVTPDADAQINTESPAWALDRLSILAVKIFHMKAETERTDASEEHLARCRGKLAVLLEQRADLSSAIDTLLADISAGRKYMKVYRQMKMYNDADTNPVLYARK